MSRTEKIIISAVVFSCGGFLILFGCDYLTIRSAAMIFGVYLVFVATRIVPKD